MSEVHTTILDTSKSVSECRRYIVHMTQIGEGKPGLTRYEAVKLDENEPNTAEYALEKAKTTVVREGYQVWGITTYEEFVKTTSDVKVSSEGIFVQVDHTPVWVPYWMIGLINDASIEGSVLTKFIMNERKLSSEAALTLVHEVLEYCANEVIEWTIYRDGHEYDSFYGPGTMEPERLKACWMEARRRIGALPENGGYMAGKGDAMPVKQRLLRKVSNSKFVNATEADYGL